MVTLVRIEGWTCSRCSTCGPPRPAKGATSGEGGATGGQRVSKSAPTAQWGTLPFPPAYPASLLVLLVPEQLGVLCLLRLGAVAALLLLGLLLQHAGGDEVLEDLGLFHQELKAVLGAIGSSLGRERVLLGLNPAEVLLALGHHLLEALALLASNLGLGGRA